MSVERSNEVIDLVAYKSRAEGCVENARDWLYMRVGMLYYPLKQTLQIKYSLVH